MDIVLGAQYGDESKGRIVDHLCSTGNYDTCVRFNGSDNAGHTVMLGEDKFAFNQIPVGAVHEMKCVIARGCMVDLERLDAEIERVERAIRVYNRPDNWSLYIDSRCHVKTQAHRDRDASEEQEREKPIGTTLSGNGPAYADKYARSNQRICDIDMSAYPNVSRKGIICDTSLLGYSHCLVEGAHGVMLDIDSGTYPFVTSSACTAAAACHSLGVSPRTVGRIIGMMKPYLTRVGAGAFPTEILEETTRSIIRERGREFGTNTKRPRRIGWLDLPALAYSVRVSGIEELVLCKTDILGYLDDVAVCTEYEGLAFGLIPAKNENYEAVKPTYECIKWNELGLVRMISLIEKLVGIPVTMVTNKESVLMR
jgi:adenylosuccinate synthase